MAIMNNLNGLNTLQNTSMNKVKELEPKEGIKKAEKNEIKLDEVKLNPKNNVENKEKIKTIEEAANKKNEIKNQITENPNFLTKIQGNNITPNQVLNLL